MTIVPLSIVWAPRVSPCLAASRLSFRADQHQWQLLCVVVDVGLNEPLLASRPDTPRSVQRNVTSTLIN